MLWTYHVIVGLLLLFGLLLFGLSGSSRGGLGSRGSSSEGSGVSKVLLDLETELDTRDLDFLDVLALSAASKEYSVDRAMARRFL